jgi:ATP diphosphatase
MMNKQSDTEGMEKLLHIMERLRSADRGCPWDRAQSFTTIAPHTIEEAHELADAIDREAWDELPGELGDLLFQVVFHAQMAREAGLFDFAAVLSAITGKLERRHPHVFGSAPATNLAAQARQWEDIKRQEREARGDTGVLSGIARGLPALSRAAKLGRRAAAVGFDWPDAAGARLKVGEELAEVDEAIAAGDTEAVEREIGDLLLAISSLARHLKIDPETSLRHANGRFERRFACVERAVSVQGGWAAQTPATLDRLWETAKSETAEAAEK